MIDKLFRAFFKFLLTVMATLLLLQAIVRALGDTGCIALLMLASAAAYLYRERSKPRRHFAQPGGSFERQRVDSGAPVGGANAEAEDEPWT